MVTFVSTLSKMINLSVADTIDERTINKKKLTPFTIQVRPPEPRPGPGLVLTANYVSCLVLRRT